MSAKLRIGTPNNGSLIKSNAAYKTATANNRSKTPQPGIVQMKAAFDRRTRTPSVHHKRPSTSMSNGQYSSITAKKLPVFAVTADKIPDRSELQRPREERTYLAHNPS